MTTPIILNLTVLNFDRAHLFNLGEQLESSTHTAAISPEQAMEAIEEIEENDAEKTAAASEDAKASATILLVHFFLSLSLY